MEGARRAESGDLDRLSELFASALAELGGQARGGRVFTTREVGGREVGEWLSSDDRIAVAGTVDSVIVGLGLGHVETLRDDARHGVIEALYVEPGARGVGVGEAMMEALLSWFGEQGVAGVDAMALPGMRETKNFFEANGFTARLLVVHHRMDGGGTDA